MNRTLAKGRDELVIKLYESGKAPGQIAGIVGCCTDNIYRILRANGIKFRYRLFTDEQLKSLLNEGNTLVECAQILNVSRNAVYARAKRNGMHVSNRIRDDEITCMQRLRENGYTNEQIAQRMGISENSVRRHIGNQPAEITNASQMYACELRKLKAQRRDNAKMALLRRKQEEERIEAERRAAEEAARREKEALEKNKREIFDTFLSIGFPQELATSASSTIETAAQGAAILDNMKKKFATAPAAVH